MWCWFNRVITNDPYNTSNWYEAVKTQWLQYATPVATLKILHFATHNTSVLFDSHIEKRYFLTKQLPMNGASNEDAMCFLWCKEETSFAIRNEAMVTTSNGTKTTYRCLARHRSYYGFMPWRRQQIRPKRRNLSTEVQKNRSHYRPGVAQMVPGS